jgi:RNA polymerase sigma factor (TIGR02999 family)
VTDSPAIPDGRFLATVYRQLRALAGRHMAREHAGHTLQATALVNEAILRLRRDAASSRGDPDAYLLAASEAMRRILIDHARHKGSARRGGDLRRLPLDLVEVADRISADQVEAIDEAIHALAREDARAATIVRLRFFIGMPEAEVARALRVSPRTVRREWLFARAWLYRALGPD